MYTALCGWDCRQCPHERGAPNSEVKGYSIPARKRAENLSVGTEVGNSYGAFRGRGEGVGDTGDIRPPLEIYQVLRQSHSARLAPLFLETLTLPHPLKEFLNAALKCIVQQLYMGGGVAKTDGGRSILPPHQPLLNTHTHTPQMHIHMNEVGLLSWLIHGGCTVLWYQLKVDENPADVLIM